MGTTLTGTTPQDTYDSLIKVTDNGPLSGTAKYLSDGLGNDSALAVSTSAVGVGTASPNAPLEVQADSGGTSIRVKGRAAANSGTIRFFNNASSTQLAKIESSDNSFEIGSVNNVYAAFLTNGTEQMRISSAGNVGIGTSSPVMPFELVKNSSTSLVGNIYYSSRFLQDSVSARGIFLGYDSASQVGVIGAETNGPASSVAFYTYSGSVWAERARVTTNGLTFNGDTAAANALDDYEEGTWTMGVSFGGASVGVTTTANTGTYTKIGRQVSVSGNIQLSSKGSSTGIARITGLPFVIGSGSSFAALAPIQFENISFTGQLQPIGAVGDTVIVIQYVTEAGVNNNASDANFTDTARIAINFTYFV